MVSDFGTVAGAEVAEGGHRVSHRADEDLRALAAAEAELAAADIEQARAARLHDAERGSPGANAEFGQPADPGLVAGDLFDLGPSPRPGACPAASTSRPRDSRATTY